MAEPKPLRVLAIILDKNSYWEQSWSTPENILLPAIEILKDKDLLEYTPELEMTLIAKERWQTRVFIVFDISHTSYDVAKGHHDLPEENKHPVSIVRLGRKLQAYPANGLTQNRINSDVSRAHNDHGIGSIPPFVTDHTLGAPMYTNLRDLSLLLR